MELPALIVSAFAAVLLVAAGSVRVRRTRVSKYELLRRSNAKSQSASEELRRELLVDDVRSLIRVIEAALLVVMAALVFYALGALGLVVMLLTALLYGKIGNIEPVKVWAQGLYDQHEPSLLSFVEKSPQLMRVIRSITTSYEDPKLSSREELEHIVEESRGLLSAREKRIILSSMQFSGKTVEDVMVPRGMMTTVRRDEVMGPLMLNDLHHTGHSRFPVMDGDIDHIVGILNIGDLLTLRDKRSYKASSMMDPKVHYIKETQSLSEALAAFLSTHRHMFVVINEYRETAGLITLEDVVEVLIGERIVDENDLHEDIRAVAERTAKSRNSPPEAVDV